jgi:phosphoesterase RecJ-like protein
MIDDDVTQRIIATFSNARSVLITTHVRPDGDALGSTAALALGLARKGIKAEILLLSKIPEKYAFAHRDAGVISYDMDRGWPTAFDFNRFDAVAVVDTGTWSQLPGMKERLTGYAKPTIVIDHHKTQEDWATMKLVDPAAAAACEVVGRLLDAWGVAIDAQIANALFLGLVTDTGWFQYSNTGPETMRLGARLMEAGVDTDRLYQAIYQNERPQRLAVQSKALQSLQLLAGGRLAVMALSKSDFESVNATSDDAEGLINVPLQVSTVEVSILLSEPLTPGPIRVSLRSKGKVDVAEFAQQFGGGGHARAAGLKMDGELAAANRQLSELLAARLGGDRALSV